MLPIIFILFYCLALSSGESSLDHTLPECLIIHPYEDLSDDFMDGLMTRKNYLKVASKGFYLWILETFGGGSLTEEDPQNICFYVNLDTASAFGRKVNLECNYLEKGSRECKAGYQSDIDPNLFGRVRVAIVWSDNQEFALGIRCVNGSRSDWAIIQTAQDSDITESGKWDIVADLLKGFGFDPYDYQKINNDKCPIY